MLMTVWYAIRYALHSLLQIGFLRLSALTLASALTAARMCFQRPEFFQF